jgi:hypothetical protein
MQNAFTCKTSLNLEGIVWADSEEAAKEKFARLAFLAISDSIKSSITTSQLETSVNREFPDIPGLQVPNQN